MESDSLRRAGSDGFYWSETLYPSDFNVRYYGFTVWARKRSPERIGDPKI